MAEGIIDVLNELLTLEHRSLALRLIEATPFVSDASADAMSLVEQLGQAALRNGARVTGAILELGGVPETPFCNDIASGELHYLKLDHLMPRLIAQHEAMTRVYTAALERLSDEPGAHAVVAQILGEHRQGLETLRASRSGAARTAG